MSTCLQGYMGHELYSDFRRYIIAPAFRKPSFTSALSLSWEIAWKHKRVNEWSSDDVMAWFLYVIEEKEHKDIVESKLHNFNLKGASLMCMTEYEFVTRDPLYGRTLYRDLQKRLQEEEEEYPPNWDSMWMNTSIYDWTKRDVIAWMRYVLGKENLPVDEIDLTRFKCSGEDLLSMSKNDFKERSPEYGQKLYEAWTCKKAEDYTTQFKEKREEIPSSAPTAQETQYSSSHSGSDSEGSMDHPPEMKYAKPRKRAGGHNRLWPFLRDLLKSGKNPEVIEWVHRDKGIFKIRDTKKLAERYGELRNNPNMSYGKIYTSLRYNCKNGYLRRVPGPKLVFGFGPYAKGWKFYEDVSAVP